MSLILLSAIGAPLLVLAPLLYFLLRGKKKETIHPPVPDTSVMPMAEAAPRVDAPTPLRDLPIKTARLRLFADIPDEPTNELSEIEWGADFLPYLIHMEERLVRYYPQKKEGIAAAENALHRWKRGLRSAQVGFYLCFYLDALEHPEAESFLMRFFAYKLLPEEMKDILVYCFPDKLQAPNPVPEEEISLLATAEIFKAHPPAPILFSARLRSLPRLNRQFYLENKIHFQRIEENPDFHEILRRQVARSGTLFLKSLLVRERPEIYDGLLSESASFSLCNRFRYDRAELISGVDPELTALLRKIKIPGTKPPFDEDELSRVREFLEQLPMAASTKELHRWALDRLFYSKPLSPIPTEDEPVEEFEAVTDIRKSYLEAIRSYEAGDAAATLEHIARCGILQRRREIRQLEARAKAATGKTEEALGIIDELLEKEPQNLSLLNDAAILAVQAGDDAKAEMIFQTIRDAYGEHPVVLHNEAVLFEKKARREIENRWKAYRETETSKITKKQNEAALPPDQTPVS